VSGYWLYVVRCADGALYTGIALDVRRRLMQHRAGRGAKALRGRGPLVLLRRCRVGALGRALRAERAMKRLPKARKEQLVAAPVRLRRWLAARA
jgi:putative endonuclease